MKRTGFIQNIERCAEKMREFINQYSDKQVWVVESAHHINTESGFAIKSPSECSKAKIWDKLEEAEKYCEEFVLNNREGGRIKLTPTLASSFFEREVRMAEGCIELMNRK